MTYIVGTDMDETLVGSGSDDTILGLGGADSLIGGGGNDSLNGGAGDDTLRGGAGINRLNGEVGDDRLYLRLSEGIDTLAGGDGIDTLDWTERTEAWRVSQSLGQASVAGELAATIGGFEWFQGGSGGDTVVGADPDETIDGGFGDDSLSGGKGENQLFGGWGDDTLNGSGKRDHSILWGGDGDDHLARGQEAHGGAGQDTLLTKSYGALWGDDGDDTLSGGASQYGGLGNDKLSSPQLASSDLVSPVLLTGGDGNDTISGGAAYWSTVITQLRGGRGDDSIVGNNHADLLGGSGSDTLEGHLLVEGGAGDDLVKAEINSFATLSGGRGNDIVIGNDRENVILTPLGNDYIDAGNGRDELQFNSSELRWKIDLEASHYSSQSGSGEIINVEDVVGGILSDHVFGSLRDNFLDGAAGDDYLSARAGDDTLIGAGGQDRMKGGDGFDVFLFNNDDLGTSSTDIILDLEADDIVDLRQIDADVTRSGDQRFTLVMEFSGEPAQAQFSYDDEGTWLLMDLDGNAVADLTIFFNGVEAFTGELKL